MPGPVDSAANDALRTRKRGHLPSGTSYRILLSSIVRRNRWECTALPCAHSRYGPSALLVSTACWEVARTMRRSNGVGALLGG